MLNKLKYEQLSKDKLYETLENHEEEFMCISSNDGVDSKRQFREFSISKGKNKLKGELVDCFIFSDLSKDESHDVRLSLNLISNIQRKIDNVNGHENIEIELITGGNIHIYNH